MNVVDTEFARLLLKRVDEEAREVLGRLTTGLLDLAEYKLACGEIRAYQRLEEMCLQVEKFMREGK